MLFCRYSLCHIGKYTNFLGITLSKVVLFLCALYGGLLIDILDFHEQNCLLKHALATPGLENQGYWTDG